MALILLDGCEDFSSFTTTGPPSIAAGRNGNGVLIVNGSGRTISFAIPAAQESDTVTIGWALRYTGFPTLGSSSLLVLQSDAGATAHLSVRGSPDGSYRVLRQLVTQLCTSAPGVIVADTWQYLELQAKLHDTTGFVTLRMNGTVIASATNVDTKNAGTKTTFDRVVFANGSAGADTTFDDVYVKAGAGDSFLGDITVETLYPNGNGNASQWVGSDGDSTNNYLLVDEVGTPVTTDYTKSATVGQIDQYALTDLANSGTILGVCHAAYVALAAAGTQDFRLVNRRTTDTTSPTQTTTSTGYAGFHYALTNDPETSAAWTVANVNALQTGVVHTGIVAATDVLLEPFNNFTFAPWTLSGTPAIVAGRNGTAAIITGTTDRADYLISSGQRSDYLTMGFAWRTNTTTTNVRDTALLYSDANTQLQNRLLYNGTTAQSFSFTRAGTTLGTSATGLVPVNTWAYIEIQVRLHSTAGAVVVRVNGTTVINLTGVQTYAGGTVVAYDGVRLFPNSTGITNLYDDLYISTGANAAPPFKGDIVVP